MIRLIYDPDPENLEHDFVRVEFTTTREVLTLDEVLSVFERFLNACTYTVKPGSLTTEEDE